MRHFDRFKRSVSFRACVRMAAFALVFAGMAAAAQAAPAGPPNAPELDPGSLAGALTVVFGGTMMLLDRRRK